MVEDVEVVAGPEAAVAARVAVHRAAAQVLGALEGHELAGHHLRVRRVQEMGRNLWARSCLV